MKAKHVFGGFIAGAALGAAAGLLFAPTSGEKTRKKIMKGPMKLKRSVIDYVDASIEGLRTQVNEKIDVVAKRGKEAINHVSEKVKM